MNDDILGYDENDNPVYSWDNPKPYKIWSWPKHWGRGRKLIYGVNNGNDNNPVYDCPLPVVNDTSRAQCAWCGRWGDVETNCLGCGKPLPERSNK